MLQNINHSIILGILVALLLAGLGFASGWPPDRYMTAAITGLCITWWITEAIPLPITSLFSLGLFSLFGVLDYREISMSYGHPVILLLLGGFIISKAMEVNNAHLRIAMTLLRLFGGNSDRKIIFGFMATSALLSMWISNAATALMLLPVAMAVLSQAKNSQLLSVPLLLGICYAANIGGMGTPIGTPPNAVFLSVYEQYSQTSLGFIDWMLKALPIAFCLLVITAWWLTRKLTARQDITFPHPGQWSKAESRVLWVFLITALLWVFRQQPFGGWSEWFNLIHASDPIIALIASVALFIIPNGKGGKLMNWEAANKIPWGILLLAASGVAISIAFKKTGLGEAIVAQFVGLHSLSLIVLILAICGMMTLVTEFTSNTAATAIMLPVLATLALQLDLDPAVLMFPAVLSASCAFMLPIATAPNMIIYGSQQVPIKTMIRHGALLNIIGVGLITAAALF